MTTDWRCAVGVKYSAKKGCHLPVVEHLCMTGKLVCAVMARSYEVVEYCHHVVEKLHMIVYPIYVVPIGHIEELGYPLPAVEIPRSMPTSICAVEVPF